MPRLFNPGMFAIPFAVSCVANLMPCLFSPCSADIVFAISLVADPNTAESVLIQLFLIYPSKSSAAVFISSFLISPINIF